MTLKTLVYNDKEENKYIHNKIYLFIYKKKKITFYSGCEKIQIPFPIQKNIKLKKK